MGHDEGRRERGTGDPQGPRGQSRHEAMGRGRRDSLREDRLPLRGAAVAAGQGVFRRDGRSRIDRGPHGALRLRLRGPDREDRWFAPGRGGPERPRFQEAPVDDRSREPRALDPRLPRLRRHGFFHLEEHQLARPRHGGCPARCVRRRGRPLQAPGSRHPGRDRGGRALRQQDLREDMRTRSPRSAGSRRRSRAWATSSAPR